MADDQEKSEEPTPKKIEDARKEGNVPKSQDVAAIVTLALAFLAFLLLFDFITSRIYQLYSYIMQLMGSDIDKEQVFRLSFVLLKEFVIMVLPLTLMIAIAGVIAHIAQFGFLFSTKPLTPDLKKIDPIKGSKNLFSLKKMIEGAKTTIKSLTVLGVGFWFFFQFIHELPLVAFFPLQEQLHWLFEKMLVIVFVMMLVLLFFALIDLVIVRRQYFNQLKMSKQEVKDEMKNMDGDPQVKAKIRQIQMQMARKRMMAEVPKADVVITNPTHFAVAIKYDQESDLAPMVIAKGSDTIAVNIKKIAREHQIHIVQNPPLARSLYKEVDLDQPIPESLFVAVAEVLAFVYQQSQK